LEAPLGWKGAGPVLALGLAAWLLTRRDVGRSRLAPAVALGIGAFVMFVVTGVTRSGLGVAQAESSRYVYLAGCLALPAIAAALADAVSSRWTPTAFAFAVCGLATVHGTGLLRTAAASEAAREQALRRQIAVAAQFVVHEDALPDARVEPLYGPDLRATDLPRLSDQLPRVRATTRDRLGAAAVLQLAAGPPGEVPFRPGKPALVGLVDAVAEGSPADECFTVRPAGATPQLVLDVSAPSSFSIDPPGAGDLVAFLRPAAPATEVGPPRLLRTDGRRLRVTISAVPTSPLVNLLASGPSVVCGVRR
jgi:hypothetical protein